MSDTPYKLKVISGNSSLALQQVSEVFRLFPDIRYELKTLKTEGKTDEDISQSDHQLQEPTTSELNRAILQNEADLAVYSACHLPYPLPVGLGIIALLNIADRSDSPVSTELSYLFSHLLPFDEDLLVGYLAIIARKERNDLKTLYSPYNLKNSFGNVTLVGFGPGNPELLTLGGDKALSQADYIFHDDLIDKAFLQQYPAEKFYVGKRKEKHSFDQEQINRLLLVAARAGKQVVRLKGGDPMVFAHGGEEVEYLQRNLIDVRVIPGVSAGMAASSYAKIPLTQRNISSSVAFISGHTESTFLPNTDTLVIYMGGSTIKKIAARAILEGRDPATPALLIHNVSLPDQKEMFYTLKELGQSDIKFPTPLIIIIGEVVSLRHQMASEIQKSSRMATDSRNEQSSSVGKVVYQPLNRMEKIQLMVNFNGN